MFQVIGVLVIVSDDLSIIYFFFSLFSFLSLSRACFLLQMILSLSLQDFWLLFYWRSGLKNSFAHPLPAHWVNKVLFSPWAFFECVAMRASSGSHSLHEDNWTPHSMCEFSQSWEEVYSGCLYLQTHIFCDYPALRTMGKSRKPDWLVNWQICLSAQLFPPWQTADAVLSPVHRSVSHSLTAHVIQ